MRIVRKVPPVSLPHADQRVGAVSRLHASERSRHDAGAPRTIEHEPGVDARHTLVVFVIHCGVRFSERDMPDSGRGSDFGAGQRGAVEQHAIEIRTEYLVTKPVDRHFPRACRADLSHRSVL